MRDPHCLKCGKHIAHFGKGWKFSVVKRHGGYYHEECWSQRVITRKRRVYPPEVRKIWNQRYWAKSKQFRNRRKLNYYWNNNLEVQK